VCLGARRITNAGKNVMLTLHACTCAAVFFFFCSSVGLVPFSISLSSPPSPYHTLSFSFGVFSLVLLALSLAEFSP
jgi:hypothetical protein